jgi:peptide/nickel transport system permease protein
MTDHAVPRSLIALPPALAHAGLVVGGTIVGIMVVAALFGPGLVPHDPIAQDLMRRLVPPAFMEGGTAEHILGTDQLGRDYLARLVYGARISLMIGLSTVVLSGLIGTTLGVAGGFFGGRTDDVVTFIITCRLAVPLILIALAVVSLVGSSLSVVVLTLGLLLWDRFAVVARASAMQIRSLDYVAAARAAGCSRAYILVREVLPNIVNPLVVVATLEMALAILLEAALSFLGLGVPPPLPSWGLMIAEARDYMFFQAWVIVIPGVALLTFVLRINLLGDGLRDVLAPESRT